MDVYRDIGYFDRIGSIGTELVFNAKKKGFGYFPAAPSSADHQHHVPAAWSSPASRTTSSPTRRPTPCSTACTAASIEPTNPDMLAFHEAFADIVALFQHFTFPDVLRHQIARTRGDLRDQNLLGQLAQQFGRATGAARRAARRHRRDRHGDRRSGSRSSPTRAAYADQRRAARPRRHPGRRRLRRLPLHLQRPHRRPAAASPPAAPASCRPARIHPDLVNRLADEAARAASTSCAMCIRALDYCPPVDLTFGEYLRALITADYDLVPDDDRGYRVAFVEAFRRRGHLPARRAHPLGGQPALAPPGREGCALYGAARQALRVARLWQQPDSMPETANRLFEHTEKECQRLQRWLVRHLSKGEGAEHDADFLGR